MLLDAGRAALLTLTLTGMLLPLLAAMLLLPARLLTALDLLIATLLILAFARFALALVRHHDFSSCRKVTDATETGHQIARFRRRQRSAMPPHARQKMEENREVAWCRRLIVW